ncbi:hypothetical protein J7E62_18405 [Variovorax paradoxus]|nr:hypothetical protein [Variovorax paradoxus]
MGSWLGRIAARYRMSVRQLCDEYALELAIDASRAGWLVLPVVPDVVVGRLARLARLDEAKLHEIQTPIGTAANGRTQLYCAHCLFVNPVDVTAPRWKRGWLNPEGACCEVHGTPLASIASSKLRRCRNFDQTLKMVGRLEFERSRGM